MTADQTPAANIGRRWDRERRMDDATESPAADPRRKPATIKGIALSSALRLRAVEWSSDVDVDAWIADIEAEARTVPAADPRLAELTEALHRDPALCAKRSPHGHPRWMQRPLCVSVAERLLALLPARTAITEAESHRRDAESWRAEAERVSDAYHEARTATTEAVALAAACVRHDLDQHGCTQAESIAAVLAATGVPAATTEVEALAAALDRLPDGWHVGRWRGRWNVFDQRDSNISQGLTLPDAIAAALAATGGSE